MKHQKWLFLFAQEQQQQKEQQQQEEQQPQQQSLNFCTVCPGKGKLFLADAGLKEEEEIKFDLQLTETFQSKTVLDVELKWAVLDSA